MPPPQPQPYSSDPAPSAGGARSKIISIHDELPDSSAVSRADFSALADLVVSERTKIDDKLAHIAGAVMATSNAVVRLAGDIAGANARLDRVAGDVADGFAGIMIELAQLRTADTRASVDVEITRTDLKAVKAEITGLRAVIAAIPPRVQGGLITAGSIGTIAAIARVLWELFK